MAVLKYKNGSGQYVPISNYTVQPIDPVQTTGSSTTAIMSQNAVTVALNTKANSADIYTKTEANNLIFGQNTVPSGSGEATNVQQLINKTVYGTTTPSSAQTSADVVTTENLATTLSGYATTSAIADFFDGAEYTNGTGTLAGKKVIAFKHGSTVKVQLDATDFVKDGMLTNAEIKDVTISGQSVKCLVLTFNTDSGQSNINIPVDDIFDADNYVAKNDVDEIVAESVAEAVSPESGTQTEAQKALTDAISDAVAKAIKDALAPGSQDTTVVQQIDKTITNYVYTPQSGSQIQLTDVMENSHKHSNKDALDLITTDKINAWNNASAGGVTNVSYNTTDKEITKTVGGITTSVVSVATLKSDMNLSSTDVGLGNVGNFKAVSTLASQGLTSTEQANARANIGAGTSSFSGNYNDLNGKPTLGDAAAKAVDSSIAASSSSVNLPTSSAVASFVEGKNYSTTDTTYKLTIGNTTNGDSVNGVNLGTLESKAAAASGTDLSLVTTGEKNVWNNKQDAIVFNTAYNASTNKAATMSDIPSVPTHGTAASGGTDLSVVTTGEMYTWNNKQDTIVFNTAYDATNNKAATMSDVPTIGTTAGTAFDGAAGKAAKDETDFMTGSNGTDTTPLTSVASIPVGKRLVRVTLSDSDSFSLEELPAAGREIHVIVKATAAVTITIPSSTSDNFYECLNDSTSMSIASGKYGEINVISDGVKAYIRYLGA